MDHDRSASAGGEGRSAAAPPPPPPYPAEAARLDSVREVTPLTRTGDPAMLRLAEEARETCGVTVGMVSLLEETEEWVVACVGTEAERIPRGLSFCAHAILEPDVLVVEDATRDLRFRANPFVLDAHHLRFYAGVPILDATGLPLGAVCVCDASPRELDSRCLLELRAVAAKASAVLEARLLLADARAHYASAPQAVKARTRLDALLLTLLDPRPPSG